MTRKVFMFCTETWAAMRVATLVKASAAGESGAAPTMGVQIGSTHSGRFVTMPLFRLIPLGAMSK